MWPPDFDVVFEAVGREVFAVDESQHAAAFLVPPETHRALDDADRELIPLIVVLMPRFVHDEPCRFARVPGAGDAAIRFVDELVGVGRESLDEAAEFGFVKDADFSDESRAEFVEPLDIVIEFEAVRGVAQYLRRREHNHRRGLPFHLMKRGENHDRLDDGGRVVNLKDLREEILRLLVSRFVVHRCRQFGVAHHDKRFAEKSESFVDWFAVARCGKERGAVLVEAVFVDEVDPEFCQVKPLRLGFVGVVEVSEKPYPAPENPDGFDAGEDISFSVDVVEISSKFVVGTESCPEGDDVVKHHRLIFVLPCDQSVFICCRNLKRKVSHYNPRRVLVIVSSNFTAYRF